MAWDRDVRSILAALPQGATLRTRARQAGVCLRGRPYRINPLGGGPGKRERLRLSLRSFDCVTFVETVVALAASRDPRSFRLWILKLRYRDGVPSWESRRHFWWDWLQGAQAAGLVRLLSPPQPGAWPTRTLVMPGLVPLTVTLPLWPASGDIPEADLVGFASSRDDLDVFHVGFLSAGTLWHASRRAGEVVAQPMEDFLAAHPSAGLILASLEERPCSG